MLSSFGFESMTELPYSGYPVRKSYSHSSRVSNGLTPRGKRTVTPFGVKIKKGPEASLVQCPL